MTCPSGLREKTSNLTLAFKILPQLLIQIALEWKGPGSPKGAVYRSIEKAKTTRAGALAVSSGESREAPTVVQWKMGHVSALLHPVSSSQGSVGWNNNDLLVKWSPS